MQVVILLPLQQNHFGFEKIKKKKQQCTNYSNKIVNCYSMKCKFHQELINFCYWKFKQEIVNWLYDVMLKKTVKYIAKIFVFKRKNKWFVKFLTQDWRKLNKTIFKYICIWNNFVASLNFKLYCFVQWQNCFDKE